VFNLYSLDVSDIAFYRISVYFSGFVNLVQN
jgi:hypothetical protein